MLGTLWRALPGFIMKLLGIAFGLLFGGLILYIVYDYAQSRAGHDGNAALVAGVFCGLGVLYSMGAVTFSRRFRDDGRHSLRVVILFGIVLSEFLVAYHELGWWYQHIETAESQQRLNNLTSDGHFKQAERAQKIIDDTVNVRSVSQVKAAINTALTDRIEIKPRVFRTLADLTADCTDTRRMGAFDGCKKVLTLREELATAEGVENAKMKIGTVVVTTTAPADAASKALSQVTGVATKFFDILVVCVVMLFSSAVRVTLFPALFTDAKPESDAKKLGKQLMAAVSGVSSDQPAANTNISTGVTKASEVKKKTPPPVLARKDAAVFSSGEDALKAATDTIKSQVAASKLPTGSVEQFYQECTRPNSTAEISFGSIYEAYTAWCTDNHLDPVSHVDFSQITNAQKFMRRLAIKRKGRVMYQGRSPLPRVVRSSGSSGGAAPVKAA